MSFESMYLLSLIMLGSAPCTSLTYNISCSCLLCLWWSSVPCQLPQCSNGHDWPCSRTTDLSDLSESRLTCKASLKHNPTPFNSKPQLCSCRRYNDWVLFSAMGSDDACHSVSETYAMYEFSTDGAAESMQPWGKNYALEWVYLGLGRHINRHRFPF